MLGCVCQLRTRQQHPQGDPFPTPSPTRRGMTSLVTRKSSRWKSEMMSRKMEEVFWDRYVAKLWKS